LSFLESTQYFPKRAVYFLKKHLPAFTKKASLIVTASHSLAKKIEQQYSINTDKIKLFQLMPADIYQPLSWKEKEVIKELYAEGKEYFLFSGEIHPGNNLVNLLKAFSFFKKRQKSNMQLIIAAKSVPAKDAFVENLKTYKYRKEVKLLTDLPDKDLAKVTAAAYAFLYPSMYDCSISFTIQAIQCEIPVITSNTSSLNEIYGDAVLYADPANFEDIADKMMLVFKDETKRAEIIKMGKLKIQAININNQANHWWKTMLEIIH
jgi:glycosyltransferase involved in cell wall biosynthesis